MAFVEAILHGWDLAWDRPGPACSTTRSWQRALEIMGQIGEMGRSAGRLRTRRSPCPRMPRLDRVLAQAVLAILAGPLLDARAPW